MQAAAELRVRWLLRTYYDAREAFDPGSNGVGVVMMPSDWQRGSYAELERCLIEMRDNGRRRQWWHATRRYPVLAEAGVAYLAQTMYGGQRERIVLPPGVADIAFA